MASKPAAAQNGGNSGPYKVAGVEVSEELARALADKNNSRVSTCKRTPSRPSIHGSVLKCSRAHELTPSRCLPATIGCMLAPSPSGGLILLDKSKFTARE